MNTPYKGEMPIDTPLVCITKFKEAGKTKHGLSVRYYAGEKTTGDHQVFDTGKMRDNLEVFDSISFDEFVAVIKVSDFDFSLQLHDLAYYLELYKVK